MSEYAQELTELVRSMAQSDPPGDRWAEVQELGLVGIGTAEEAGGSGGTLADLIVLVRELARAGIATPIVEASTTLYAAGATSGFDTVAIIDADVQAKSVTVDLGAVPYAATAARIVLVGTAVVAAVGRNAVGVNVLGGTDLAGAETGRVKLDGAVADLIDKGPGAEAVTCRLALSRSAQLLGSCIAAYELTRSYVAERVQFGSPLIAIPAVSAALAQMSVRLRSAQTALDRAVDVFDDDAVGGARCLAAAASARILAADTATYIARTAHQLHGAVGITGEYELHRHTRKLWATRDLDRSVQRWAQLLGASARQSSESELWGLFTA